MASNVGDVHVEIESCRLDFYKRVSNARFMGKKTKKQARLEKRPFTSEKGKNPEKASEKRKNPGKKKNKIRGWLQIRVGHAAAHARLRPGSRTDLCHAVDLGLARWSGRSRANLGLARTWVALRPRSYAVVR